MAMEVCYYWGMWDLLQLLAYIIFFFYGMFVFPVALWLTFFDWLFGPD